MRVKTGIAVLAIGVSLAGCGTAGPVVAPAASDAAIADRTGDAMKAKMKIMHAEGAPRTEGAPQTGIPGGTPREQEPQVTVPGDTPREQEPQVTVPGATPREQGPQVTVPGGTPLEQEPQQATTPPAVEAGKDAGNLQKVMIKRMFAFFESKNPQAKDRLHALEQRLLALDMPRMTALKSIRYQERKDRTLDEIRKELETYVQNPDALIEDIGADLNRVEAMSAQDLSAARADLPPVFSDIMRAMSEPVDVAGHEGGRT